MSEILIPKLDPICWLKQTCKWWQHDMVCPGHRVRGWPVISWGRMSVFLAMSRCQSWSGLAFSQSGPGSIIIGDDCPAWWHDQDTRVEADVSVTVTTHVELRLPRGGWKNEREIVARNKNMLRTKPQSWQNKHWALLVIFMLVAWKCDVFRLDKTKRSW